MSTRRAKSSMPCAPSFAASRAAPPIGGKPLSIVASTGSQARRYGSTSARQRAPSPSPSASRLACVRARSRESTAACPPGSGCAMAISGWTQRSPWRSSSSPRITGDATAAGCTAEKTSWRKPGSVSSSVASAPPERRRGLDDEHGAPGARERDRGDEPVGSRADDDRVVALAHAGAARRAIWRSMLESWRALPQNAAWASRPMLRYAASSVSGMSSHVPAARRNACPSRS